MAYQTAISRYERNALAKAAALAIAGVLRGGFAPATAPLGYAFRVDDATYAQSNEDGDYVSSGPVIEIEAFIVTKVTENGFRIRIGGWDHNPMTRWIANHWNKQFAGRTPEDAMRSYIARRKRQASIYRARANRAESLVKDAEYTLQQHEEPTNG